MLKQYGQLKINFSCQNRHRALYKRYSSKFEVNFILAIGSFHANFTNLGASGRLGPQSLGSHYVGRDNENMVTVQNGIQFWTVPYTGTYEITAVGAVGGKDDYGGPGGRGACMKGEFDLIKGDVIKILVGQEGFKALVIGGGGGGTFVATSSNTPIIVAGGGGGAEGLNDRLSNCDANTETTGKSNACGSTCSVWAGGVNGTGALYGDANSCKWLCFSHKYYIHYFITGCSSSIFPGEYFHSCNKMMGCVFIALLVLQPV